VLLTRVYAGFVSSPLFGEANVTSKVSSSILGDLGFRVNKPDVQRLNGAIGYLRASAVALPRNCTIEYRHLGCFQAVLYRHFLVTHDLGAECHGLRRVFARRGDGTQHISGQPRGLADRLSRLG
jgi:hypothetical protein